MPHVDEICALSVAMNPHDISPTEVIVFFTFALIFKERELYI